MMANPFSLYTASKSVLQLLRARADTVPEAAAELRAAIEQIEALWSELRAQSEVLTDERQRYAEFFEFAPDCYLVTEPLGEIREANRAARELLGMKPGGLEGISLMSFVPDADRTAFRGRLVAVRGGPEGEPEEWPGILNGASGEPRPAVFRVRSIKVRRKNAEGLCWLIRV